MQAFLACIVMRTTMFMFLNNSICALLIRHIRIAFCVWNYTTLNYAYKSALINGQSYAWLHAGQALGWLTAVDGAFSSGHLLWNGHPYKQRRSSPRRLLYSPPLSLLFQSDRVWLYSCLPPPVGILQYCIDNTWRTPSRKCHPNALLSQHHASFGLIIFIQAPSYINIHTPKNINHTVKVSKRSVEYTMKEYAVE